MKKFTLISGLISSLIVMIGVLFKILHWPGAAIAMTVGIGLFATIYSIFLFIDKQKFAKTAAQKTANIFVLLAMITISIGFLFKEMHWPGAGVIIYVSNFALLILIPVVLVKAAKETDVIKKLNSYNEGIILILLLAFSLFLLFLL
ncbi:MAG TPA: hypothetical protein PLV65_03470 [Tenuifilaceae bacterium]|nr:hypothetical protein [Tenuifilaceae bacterium]